MTTLTCLIALAIATAQAIPSHPRGGAGLSKRCFGGFDGCCCGPTFFADRNCVDSNCFHENNFDHNVAAAAFCEDTHCDEVDANRFRANNFNTLLD